LTDPGAIRLFVHWMIQVQSVYLFIDWSKFNPFIFVESGVKHHQTNKCYIRNNSWKPYRVWHIKTGNIIFSLLLHCYENKVIMLTMLK